MSSFPPYPLSAFSIRSSQKQSTRAPFQGPQLSAPVCNFNFRRNCFITRSLFRLKQILIVFFVCFLGCQLVFFSYACSTVYFTFSTIAILAALNSFACTFVTCFSMKTQYSIDPVRLTTYNSDLYLRARSFASFWANRSDPLLPAESCCCC